MLDTVPTAPKEMTGTAVFAGGAADTLGHLLPIRWIKGFVVTLENGGLRHRVPGAGRIFFVRAGLFMTDQAVDAGLVGEIEVAVFPAKTGVTGCATSLVALDVDSEVVY